MGSRKEEERNEKIIRGLMKLPPNRRCINCNSLGPQYVCTNFWTFVCMTCSGIHREFTHRVKSVSMSKFTSQEVEALQNGGNQRAREIYLRDWDQQRQRLPDNSNVDKVRQFIKTVYVDRKYAGGKSHDKPPRDLQRLRSNEEETRRASSYHSYSQSPPYDFQYEDRRYGKQAGVLTRKPGSDKGHYVGKMSSFICSPTRSNERTLEDRFANEGSVSRVSDFSASSGGDLFSPNFQRENSTPIQTPSNTFGEDAHQRSTSLGSMGSFDSNSISLRSFNSGSLDQFKASVVPESSPPIDLFLLPETPPLDPATSDQSTHTGMPVSLDLFAGISEQQSIDSLKQNNTVGPSAPKNEGWATFDAQPISPTRGTETEILTTSVSPPFVGSSVQFYQVSSSNTSMPFPWPPSQNSNTQGSSSVPEPWKNNELHDFQSLVSSSNLTWNAFGGSVMHFPLEGSDQTSEPQDPNMDQNQRSVPYEGLLGPYGVSDAPLDPPYTPAVNPMMEANQSYAANHKSTNPFDLPYDSEMEPGNMFLDMGSLQAALPNEHEPSTFIAGVTEQWFPQDPATNCIPVAPQGGLAYMAGQSPNTQIPNVRTQGPVASIGGNPFA